MDDELATLSQMLGQVLGGQGLVLTTAESCTGGWVAELVTDTAGSSDWFDRGFVTYSNQAKHDMLGVRSDTITCFGAVSEACAQEMAVGALANSTADWTLSITGIAGPGGGSSDKPVGTVCFSWCRRGDIPCSATMHFSGDRRNIRREAVKHAIQELLRRLGN